MSAGDALGLAIFPGDRKRRSHDAVKERIYVDGRILEVDIQKEECGLFTHYHGHQGRTAYETQHARTLETKNRVRPRDCKQP